MTRSKVQKVDPAILTPDFYKEVEESVNKVFAEADDNAPPDEAAIHAGYIHAHQQQSPRR